MSLKMKHSTCSCLFSNDDSCSPKLISLPTPCCDHSLNCLSISALDTKSCSHISTNSVPDFDALRSCSGSCVFALCLTVVCLPSLAFFDSSFIMLQMSHIIPGTCASSSTMLLIVCSTFPFSPRTSDALLMMSCSASCSDVVRSSISGSSI